MNERPTVNRLRDAMRNASIADLDEVAEELGEQAVAIALAERPAPMAINQEEERERLQDAAFADAIEMVNRQRNRLGRRVCSRPDATTTRKIFELLRSMAGADGGCDNDPSFL